MIYGYFDFKRKIFHKLTRISSTAILLEKQKISIADNVWIGHYCLIDGIGNVEISEGVHIASHSVVYSHSSHNSIRLLGKKYIHIPTEERIGYILKKVKIGPYSFIGTSCVILPGTILGKGCVVAAGSVVKGSFSDFSIVAGSPAIKVGDVRDRDLSYFEDDYVLKNYFDQETIKKHLKE